jgi:hypothetical protein
LTTDKKELIYFPISINARTGKNQLSLIKKKWQAIIKIGSLLKVKKAVASPEINPTKRANFFLRFLIFAVKLEHL